MKKINPDTLFILLLLLMFILDFMFPRRYVLFPISLAGIPVLLLGFWLMIWSHAYFKATTIKPEQRPTRFILEGPYMISRNPMYLGGIVMMAGISMLLQSFASLVGPLLLFLLLELYYIPMEERNLEAAFRKRYIDYKHRIRRWI